MAAVLARVLSRHRAGVRLVSAQSCAVPRIQDCLAQTTAMTGLKDVWATPESNLYKPGLCRIIKETYAREGFALLDKPASQAELGEIERYLDLRIADNHPGNVLDSEGNCRAVHGLDEGFCPSLMNRLGAQACELIGCESVYVFQFRINTKFPSKSGSSGAWVPHRDFDFWHHMDGMPHPRAVLMHLCVNEHTEANGPVFCCDESHLTDVAPVVNKQEGWEAGFREDLKYTLEEHRVQAWHKHTPMIGAPGTTFAMHPLLWHYSHPNLSEEPRVLMSIIFSDTKNICKIPEGAEARPEFIARLAPNARGGHWTQQGNDLTF